MQNLAALQAIVNEWDKMLQDVEDARELIELSMDELKDDATAAEEAEYAAEVAALKNRLADMEFAAALSGSHDKDDAVISISAGAGGTESQDWVEMLLRMYLRWAEGRKFKTTILDQLAGEGAGLKSVTALVKGEYAYGYLKSEKGVHRLVRLSPFDAAHRRHTSFALVEVLPQVEDDLEVEINPKDLRIDTFRASSAGGQNVQKNATAVRITHLPTGIVVSCQNERSLTQNKENALKVLKARLLELKQREQAEKMAELRGEYQKAEWGSQIRSYVLHPYQMVKDHRTGYEVGNAQAVLDGDLDGFIEAYLRRQIGQAAEKK